jgi:hypothetical protein
MVQHPLSVIALNVEAGAEVAKRIQFEDAIKFDTRPLTPLLDAANRKTQELAPIIEGFDFNIVRAMMPLGLPAHLIYWSKHVQLAQCQGWFKVTGDPNTTGNIDADTYKKCMDATVEYQMSWLEKDFDEGRMFPPAEFEKASATIPAYFAFGTRAGHGLIAILSNAITNSWTAFETLSGDLWELAINLHPQELSKLDGRGSGKKARDEDKKLDLSYVHRHNYNLSSVMGTILKNRYGFSFVSEIKNAYRDAFARDFPDLDDLIDPEMAAL